MAANVDGFMRSSARAGAANAHLMSRAATPPAATRQNRRRRCSSGLTRGPDLARTRLRRRRRRAARRAAAAADARRGDRPAAPARPGQAAARRVRVRPAALDDPVGPAGRRQDDAGAPDGRRVRRRSSSRISAVLGGVKDIREAVERAQAAQHAGRRTVVFVDEVHRFNKASRTPSCRTSSRACSPSSARPPRTRRSRSTRRCCRAPRCTC